MDLPLLEWLHSLKGNPSFVLVHSIGDLDALASALALSELYGCKVVAVDKLNSSAKSFCKKFGVEIARYPEIKEQVMACRHLVSVDCSEKHLLPQEIKSYYIVIDHHGRKNAVLSEYSYNDPSAAATSEIIASLCDTDSLSVMALAALAAGIYSDSYRFMSASGSTIRTFSELLQKSGISYQEIQEFAHPPLLLEERLAILTAAKRMECFKLGDFVFALSSVNAYEGEAAAAFIKLGADAALVVHFDNDGTARISGRLSHRSESHIDISSIMASVAERCGASGGGHRSAAGITGLAQESVQLVIDSVLLGCIASLRGSGLYSSAIASGQDDQGRVIGRIALDVALSSRPQERFNSLD